MKNQDRWLFLFIQAVPCCYRCKHCSFAAPSGFKQLNMKYIIEISDYFVQEKDKQETTYKNIAINLGDCALNHSDLVQWVCYLKDLQIEGWRSIPVNGFYFQKYKKWKPVLESLKNAGTEFLEFTLYGLGKTHDWFAEKIGSYLSIRYLADIWSKMDGKTIWNIFIHKNNISQIDQLRSEILKAYKTRSSISLWSYLGYGTEIENLRIEKSDLNILDTLTCEELDYVKSEREWINELLDINEFPFPSNPGIIHISVDSSGDIRIPYTTTSKGHEGFVISKFPVDSVEITINKWYQEYKNWIKLYPSVKELCNKYGDKSSNKLHDKRSIIRKWCSLHESR